MNNRVDINTSELEAILDENPTIIDVREPDEFASGHIPTSINIPLGDIDNFHPDKKVYLICHSGRRSGVAATILAAKGYEVSNVCGGMLQWDGPITKGE